MDERDHKAMNDELKKEQPSIELQISDEQLDKIKSCEVLKINGMEFISRTKTTEMLIKFANEQLKEKEEEIDRLKSDMKIKCNSYDHLHETNSYNFTKLCELQLQLTKSNEMAEKLAEALFEVKFDNIQYGGITGVVKDKMNEALTEYQNSKK